MCRRWRCGEKAAARGVYKMVSTVPEDENSILILLSVSPYE